MTRIQKRLAGLLVITVVVVTFDWFNRGYGKVSTPTYGYVTALYGACLARSDERVKRVESMLESEMKSTAITHLPENEVSWLQAIIDLANDGRWEAASSKARRMLDEQVEF